MIAGLWLLGTHEEPLGALAPTGRPIRCRMAAFFAFEGADLVCERAHFDSATMLRQLTAET